MLEEIGRQEVTNKDNVVTRFRDLKERLLVAMRYVIKTYELINFHKEDMIGLDIKLPVSRNFSDFRKNIDDLDFILTKCPFFRSGTETLQFKSVHHGSVSLTFIVVGVGTAMVGGSILLNNIAAFIDKCFIIKSHELTVKKQKLEVENSELEKKEKEEIYKQLIKLYKIVVRNELKKLEQELNYEIKDGDEMGRAEQSVEKFNKLIDEGIQIYSTIGSPDEIKALVEPLEMKYLSLIDQLKLIDKKD